MDKKWDHEIYEGAVVIPTPTELKKDFTPEFKHKFPASYAPPQNIHLFLYPELPDTNFLPSYFIVTFTTPQGTLFGHTLRTEKYSICLISFYCWEVFFRKLVMRADTCLQQGDDQFLQFLQEIKNAQFPFLQPNTIFNLQVSVIIEKLLSSQILLLFNSLICERRIIVVGSNYETVTTFVLSIMQLLEPLTWPHPIVTLLPKCFSELVDLPTPYICGMSNAQFTALQPFSNKVVVVDVDQGTTRSNHPDMIKMDSELLPVFATNFLKESLKAIQRENPSQIPVLVQQTFLQFVLKLLQAPETFITIRKKRNMLIAEMDMEKYKKTYVYKSGSRKFIDFFVKTGAFDQYLLRLQTDLLKKSGKVIEKPEPNFWDALFQFNFPTEDLTKKRGEQYKMQ
ncbi:hypothetical protein EIN_359150 [Entamoeba invadens IP1]|uniref:UDENN domain-containing protein n=1 Tax=Entamoeba invadens IP1 TaxID=370355 RepID=A0A0A1U7M2_ENTIV|nr:hypothetical protein EIN_359150 [Entamoeba invadens IP1]ELP90832.1 hypothetical protein EIN_359150 [Entamoeba invadens IP1]|eukprot:XP_004257603.1 hypothetical protein EIN_359150 [Entamoeba invadens IP1]